ncbi:MAG TPA: transposase [Candidatus Methylomirabilis sp.]|nr:transposase [Candidatus Methylomirabilis sp.]
MNGGGSYCGQQGTIRAIALDMWEPYILAAAACVPDAAQKIVFDRYHATRYVKEEAAGALSLDLVRDNRMPGRGRSA